MRRRDAAIAINGGRAAARAGEGRRGPPPSLQVRILEELIYERVRVAFNLCELLDFQSDLSVSIDRALDDCADAPDQRADLVLSLLERAWERLSDEVLTGLAAAECRLDGLGDAGLGDARPAAVRPGEIRPAGAGPNGLAGVRPRRGRRAADGGPPPASPTESAGTSGTGASTPGPSPAPNTAPAPG